LEVERWSLNVERLLLMRVAVLNTGTELLLGDVQNAHLAFIAAEIFPLGLRIDEQRTVPDGMLIRTALTELFPRTEILFVTGGLGPTTDDITRDIVADLLDLELRQDTELLTSLQQRLKTRGIKWTSSIARQADVPAGAQILPNENGSAPGLYLKANINPAIPSSHVFLLPGPPRELQPMFRDSLMSILRTIVPGRSIERRIYKIASVGESIVEKAIGTKILSVPGIDLGYCARPGEVDVRIVGEPDAVARADKVIRTELGSSIFSTRDETLEEVLVKMLARRKETVALAESCTGGLLAHRLTNVPGSSEAFLAGYVVYANEAKMDVLNIDPKLIEQYGAVSEPVVRSMAEGARARASSTYALATTGVAGPTGGSPEKPVGTVYIGLAASDGTAVKRLFCPSDREMFKQLVAQAAFEFLRRKLIGR
jgi:nicotinamide-nucleotide amidase